MDALSTTDLQVTKRPEKLTGDDSRVITRLFVPSGRARVRAIVDRVMGLSDRQVSTVLAQAIRSFAPRHEDIGLVFEEHFREVVPDPELLGQITEQREMLIGAYFTMEYSFESAALFNPSIVPHPDQSGLDDHALRFLMSLRATGEGHISSIVFRSGVIDATGHISFDPVSRYPRRIKKVEDRLYEKELYYKKLAEMGVSDEGVCAVFERLPLEFTLDNLNCAIDAVGVEGEAPDHFEETADNILWLARSNYHLEIPAGVDPSEVVIFPTSENESNGIEDVRLTRFVDDDGQVTYYGLYTAYNGSRILPQLLQTPDFKKIKIRTLGGKCVRDKGVALFPRKVDGQYAMIGRLDGENLFIMRSENILAWNQAQKLHGPTRPWEFIQIGNCGPPIETPQGWLLLTHGVGPVRRYCIGCLLLDLDDPSRVIGHLREPLLAPNEEEREGYVPNVVYSCGSLIHGQQLIMPYAMSDSATRFATVAVSDLLDRLV